MGLWGHYLDWRKRNVVAIETGDDGFLVRHGRTTHDVRWSAIDAVCAFKRDLLTVDRLCLIVECDGSAIELDEEMGGFDRWLAAMEMRLGIAKEWRIHVLFPAFEASLTEIFRREPRPAGLKEAIRC